MPPAMFVIRFFDSGAFVSSRKDISAKTNAPVKLMTRLIINHMNAMARCDLLGAARLLGSK